MEICNWGNYPRIDATLIDFDNAEDLLLPLAEKKSLIARGLGRCYGDSALNETIISTLRFNRLLAFDDNTGVLTCEAGVSLKEIIDVFMPRGWFLPVTPGTKYVTVGGAIASDVHGKNHHNAGTFSNHLISVAVLLSSGSIQSCSRHENGDLFWSTCGGMGMTGIIVQATFQLIPIPSSYIVQETLRAGNLGQIMELFETSIDWTYTVAWIDCLTTGKTQGRSILMRGKHAKAENLTQWKEATEPFAIKAASKINIPVFMPNWILSNSSVRLFNSLYYNKAPRHTQRSITDYDKFFYPLDSLINWNRIYGKRGFTQYQFVLPKEGSGKGLKKILARISAAGLGSFLGVLKLFGKQNNLISFPMEGYTLALDFPINERLFPFLDTLDDIVLDYGGRLYLTKDVRMSERIFRGGYKKSEKFIALKHRYDPQNKFQSMQSQRLGI